LIKLVILARDGLINEYSGVPIGSADDWQPIPGSLEAIARLNQAGLHVAVATNQPGLARGLFDLDALNAIHHKFHDLLDRLGGHVDAVSYCPHEQADGCGCRKPQPGMLLQLGERFGALPQETVMIGTSGADLDAARAAGMAALRVQRGGEGSPADVAAFDSLARAVAHLLQEGR
jgi:D-glycero-D-manno-heptose 1,7-bisphosphate phosphatase